MLYTKSNYLKLIIGPMFSSKSSHLLEEINRYKHITNNIICINHQSDKFRYTQDKNEVIDNKFIYAQDKNEVIDNKIKNDLNVIRTHNLEIYKSFMCYNLSELNEKKEYQDAEVVIIDEAQFFTDLYLFIERELRIANKKVFIIAGLSGDINLKSIGEILQLIPLANEIKQLSALCLQCNDGTLANFTKRKEDNCNNTTIIVGGTNLYEPVCRYHYHYQN